MTKQRKTSVSKTQRIRSYLSDHPLDTWKDAEPVLAKHGVTGSYFAMIKSKLKSGRGDSQKSSIASNVSNLEAAKAFAQSCGGIDSAIAALNELKKYQV